MNTTNTICRWTVLALLGAALTQATYVSQAALFGPAGDTVKEKQATIRQQRDDMLAELYRTKPELKERLPKAAGCATFK